MQHSLTGTIVMVVCNPGVDGAIVVRVLAMSGTAAMGVQCNQE